MPFNSNEFHEFAKQWNYSIKWHERESSLNRKTDLKKTNDPYNGLIEYRNTPITGMAYSPTQLLMGRLTRTKIPISKELRLAEVPTEAKQQLAQQQKRQKLNYNKSTKPLQAHKKRENVHLHRDDIWIPATLTGLATNSRSYHRSIRSTLIPQKPTSPFKDQHFTTNQNRPK